MRSWNNLIFAAMPVGREVTSADVWARCQDDLPRGWRLADVAQILRRMVDLGGVERVGVVHGATVYRRTWR